MPIIRARNHKDMFKVNHGIQVRGSHSKRLDCPEQHLYSLQSPSPPRIHHHPRPLRETFPIKKNLKITQTRQDKKVIRAKLRALHKDKGSEVHLVAVEVLMFVNCMTTYDFIGFWLFERAYCLSRRALNL